MHTLSELNVYTDNLFLARSCRILTENAFLAIFKKHKTLAKFLQELRKCCKIVARILQDYFQIHQSCKICIFHKIFAKVELIARILEDFCKSYFSCELGTVSMS